MLKFKNKIPFCMVLSAVCMSSQADLTLQLDQQSLGNMAMPIMEDVVYDVMGQEIKVVSKYPLICNQVDNNAFASPVLARILSPNNDEDTTTSGTLGMIENVNYNLSQRTVTMVSENLNKAMCLTSTFHDLIYRAGFEDDVWQPEDYPAHFQYYNVTQSQPKGDQFQMGVEYTNTTGSMALLDLIEYWPHNSSLDVSVNTNGVSCQIFDDQDVYVEDCDMDFSALGKYKNLTLLPGYKVRTANNFIIHQNSIEGNYLYLMAAVFNKVETIQSVGSNQSFQSAEFIEAKLIVDPPTP